LDPQATGIAPPPGYGGLVPLDRQRHRERGIDAQVARFASGLHAVYLSLPEFVAASRHLPIVFSQVDASHWQPLALTGLEPGRNLCVDGAGDWLAGVYCPAYVRRYPFCTARVREDGADRSVVCVDERGLGPSAPFLFDGRGEDTPRWRELRRFIEEFDQAVRQTDAFCARLVELALLEPFEADVLPVGAGRKRVTGMWRVAEGKLRDLPGATLSQLMRTGYLSRIHAHLMSLDLFHRLLELDVARAT